MSRSVWQRYASGAIGPRIGIADIPEVAPLATLVPIVPVLEVISATIIPPVADLEGLKNVTLDRLHDKATVLVATMGQFRYEADSTVTPDDADVVLPDNAPGGIGRFIRMTGTEADIDAITGLPETLANKLTKPDEDDPDEEKIAIFGTDGTIHISNLGVNDIGGGFVLEPVDDLDALKAILFAGLSDKQIVLVELNGFYRFDLQSVLDVNEPFITKPNDVTAPDPGRWIRVTGAASASASRAIHYVDVDGSDTEGDGSYVAPWATIGKAINTAAPGEVIQLSAGQFDETFFAPLNVSFRGAGLYQTIITGPVSFLSDDGLVSISNLTINGTVELATLTNGGGYELSYVQTFATITKRDNTTVFSEFCLYNSSSGPALVLEGTTGDTPFIGIRNFCQTSDDAPAINHTGGIFAGQLNQAANNSATRASFESTGGLCFLMFSAIQNSVGFGPGVLIDNDSSEQLPNVLFGVVLPTGVTINTPTNCIGVVGGTIAGDGARFPTSDRLAYTPATPANWDGDAPTTIQEALDRIAVVVSANGATPIPEL